MHRVATEQVDKGRVVQVQGPTQDSHEASNYRIIVTLFMLCSYSSRLGSGTHPIHGRQAIHMLIVQCCFGSEPRAEVTSSEG